MQRYIGAGLAVLLVAVAGDAAAQAPTGRACDRSCLNALVDSYLAALVAHDPSKVAIAPRAKFVENIKAMPVGDGLWNTCAAQLNTGTMAYIDFGNRRVEIADPDTGLVFGLSHFHHSMKQKFVTIKGVPGVERLDFNIDAFDLPAAHIFKVSGGKLHEIEAMGFVTGYNSPSGW